MSAEPNKPNQCDINLSTPALKPSSTVLQAVTLKEVAAAAACGIAFGFVLNKSGVYKAEVIRDQFRFKDLTMLKTFLTAATTSTGAITVMYYLDATKQQINLINNVVYNVDLGALSVALGGFLLGSGMAISGACPGTLWVQLGAGSVATLYTLLGGVVAAGAYGTLHDTIMCKLGHIAQLPKKCIGELMGLGRVGGAVLLGTVMSTVVLACEKFQPFVPRGLPSSLPLNFNFKAPNWHPVLCGLGIGLLQFPLLTLLGKNLGSSSSFATLASNAMNALHIPAANTSSYLKKFRSGFINWWQVLFVSCAAVGSAVAIATSSTPTLKYNVSNVVTPLQSLLGGFMLVFGARLANGCTSGHGITGMGHQALRSMLAVASMFAGGIATTALLF